ncbi:unnamed protein product, partial [Discosporangium mesarthrocarpum]
AASAAGSGGGGSYCSLEDCLQAFSAEEVLDGDNRPACEHCGRRRKSSKHLLVHRYPPVLVVHIKRFQYTSSSRNKLSKPVTFPLQGLDLRPFVTVGARPTNGPGPCGAQGSATGSGGGSSPGVDPIYDLFGVANHMGGLGGGHYTAHCLNRGDGQWYTFDDTHVSRVSPHCLGGSSAYVLFY